MTDAGPLPCPPIILEKVRQFTEHIDVYKSGDYSEAQLRIDFLNPMLEALGWDVENTLGYAEAYRDVVYEDQVKVGGAAKAPDYGFYVGGRAAGGGRKFFLEAKKPSINLRVNPAPAYQLRRYAWTAKLSLSILTSFEEFIVYDTRVKPLTTDKATTASILTVAYTEYPQRWHEIVALFSIDAIRRGSFDRFAQSMKKQRGTAPVDDAFLHEIEQWREDLAQTIAKDNPKISRRDLNFSVQRTIDRIIFLRMCEDRGIESPASLKVLLNGDRVYTRLSEMFHRADDRYNSGLFHFATEKGRDEVPDQLTLRLDIDDKVLKHIIKGLYDSPYEFSVMPPEILGQVYEQFLGKVIILTAGHRAKVEPKPEVRKAGGVYYTPAYIVDDIVKHTVGKLLGDLPYPSGEQQEKPLQSEGPLANERDSERVLSPKRAENLRILDPACGSGSFLIGAYQYLLDWHLRWYLKNDPDQHCKGKNPPLMRMTRAKNGLSGPTRPSVDYRLTTAKRKEILLNSIYGVDIDPQAVEVTKLSLLLKILEGESQESINTQLRLFHERALPDLGRNIKCGNSLIGSQFYATQQLTLSEEDRIRINVFDWDNGFPEIMKLGGFDAVIGNPPYIFGEYHDANTKAYLESNMRSAVGQYDTYWLFIERALDLTRHGGRCGLIVPDALLARDECSTIRELLLSKGLERLYHCGLVFSASVSALVFTIAKGSRPAQIRIETREGERAVEREACSSARFMKDPRKKFLIYASDAEAVLIDGIRAKAKPLLKYARLSRGEELGKKNVLATGPVPILVGENIGCYSLSRPTRFIRRPEKDRDLYRSPKIVIVKTGAQCIASLDRDSLVTMQSVYNLHIIDDTIPIESMLAILNSRLTAYLVKKTFTAYKLLFPQLNQTTIEDIPVVVPDSEQQREAKTLVDRMLELRQQLMAIRSPVDQERLSREIEAIGDRIDQFVYGLYDLTSEQIRIVEQATVPSSA